MAIDVANTPTVLRPTVLQIREHANAVFYHMPETNIPFETILDPSYWAHVAAKMKAGNEIRVDAFDMSWSACLKVRWADRVSAKVGVIAHAQFEAIDEAEMTAETPYEVKWRSPTRKHGVIRKSDGQVLKDGFETKPAAHLWAGNYFRNMAA